MLIGSVLAGLLPLAAACAKANLPPEDDTVVPLPDRVTPEEDVTVADTSVADVSLPDVADTAPPVLRVFVTSSSTTANFQGLQGGDQYCKTLAMAQSMKGDWAAWLSSKDGIGAIDRITSTGPWQLLTGEVVASSKTELASGTLKHAIDRDEKGAAVVGGHAWTGTGPNGQYLTNDCDTWTTGGMGRVGSSDALDMTWTSAAVDDCGSLRRLYCFQL